MMSGIQRALSRVRGLDEEPRAAAESKNDDAGLDGQACPRSGSAVHRQVAGWLTGSARLVCLRLEARR